MGVVERHEKRRLLGCGREQAQRRRSDSQPVGRWADVEGECGSKGCRLPGRELVNPREERSRHLEETPERHLGLGLDALCSHHQHARRLLDRVAHEGCLPDPGLAAKEQAAAGPVSCFVQEPADRRALELAPQEHAPTVPQARKGRFGGSPEAITPGRLARSIAS